MLPSTLLRSSVYRRYYTSRVELVEDLLRGLSLVLPGRFQDADLCSQSILSALNLVLLYNTHLLERRHDEEEQKRHSDDEKSSRVSFTFNDFVKRQYYSSWISKTAAICLSIVNYTEVVFEMLLRHKKPAWRWRWITCVEILKALMRFVLFRVSENRTVMHPTHIVRNIDPSSFELNTEDKFELSTIDPRVGVPSTSNPDLLTLTTTTTTTNPGYASSRQGWAHIGELLWIIRPVIYAYMIYRHVQRLSSAIKEDNEEEERLEKDEEDAWKPWLVSLGIDMLAHLASEMQPMTRLEKEEWKRRSYLWLYYLFRGPLYIHFTKPLLDTFCDTTENRPLLSVVAGALNDYRPFWEQSYFYTSAS